MKADKEKINETIDLLVKGFEHYVKNVNDRLKINSIFNEFEEKARGDLMSLVKLSNSRYKGVKSGNSLESVLHKQSPIYNQIVNTALGDQFYRSDDIFSEKKKFRKMNNKVQNQEINNLREKIKETTKALNADDGENPYEQCGKYKEANLKFQKKLEEVKSPTTEEINRKTNKERKVKVNFSTVNSVLYYPNHSKKKSILGTEMSHLDNNNESFITPRKLFADLVNEDKLKFDKQLTSYQTHLDKLREQVGEPEILKSPKKFTFLTDDLKILSYKQVSNNNKVEKKDKNDKVEVNKLIKYTKLSSKQGRTIKDHLSNNENELDTLQKTKEFYKSHSDLSTNNKLEQGNTIQFVKNEILNALYIDEIIKQKKNALEDWFKDSELPKMDDYDKIMMRNLTTQKISQHTSVAPKIKEEVVDKSKKKELAELLKENYENKQNQWKVEDVHQENIEQFEKERRKETKMFLNQIKKRPRFAQQFIDQYSIRDEKINKNILDLNKILGKKLHDKKKLNKKIDEFINSLEYKENEEKEKMRLSDDKPMLSADEEVRKILRANLETEDEGEEYKFGSRENEIVLAVVNSTVKKEKTAFQKMRENYEDFLLFKDKVIVRDQRLAHSLENPEEKEKINNSVPNFNRRGSRLFNMNNTSLLKRSSEEIIFTLRRSSLTIKNISNNLFLRRNTKSDLPVVDSDENYNPLKNKFARNIVNINHAVRKTKTEEHQINETSREG